MYKTLASSLFLLTVLAFSACSSTEIETESTITSEAELESAVETNSVTDTSVSINADDTSVQLEIVDEELED